MFDVKPLCENTRKFEVAVYYSNGYHDNDLINTSLEALVLVMSSGIKQ